MHAERPVIVVIVGITGDLAKRKLLPALAALKKAGIFSMPFRVVGVTRKKGVTLDEVLGEDHRELGAYTTLLTMDVTKVEEYARLSDHLRALEADMGEHAQRLFYLSVPPSGSQTIIENLGRAALSQVPDTKLLIEKPFGTDLGSAKELIAHISAHFNSSQVYRIDHYLAKEMAQNLIVFRERNPLFARTWNKDYIERVEIRSTETIGIEGRVSFYEQTGALRDLVQSHLLQLAALTLMPPSRKDTGLTQIPERRLAALSALSLSKEAPLIRGQYEGYTTEVGNPGSCVETFVQLTLESQDPLFTGVPITLTTGKKLPSKTTEIRIHYKKDAAGDENVLTLRLQPNEGVSLTLLAKRPGYTSATRTRVLDFAYAHEDSVLAEAYEKVLVDAISGDHDLFVSNEEVIESWRILAPVQEAWKKDSKDLVLYGAGTDPLR